MLTITTATSSDELINLFNAFNTIDNTVDEQQKLQIIQAVEQRIKNKMPRQTIVMPLKAEAQFATSQFFREALYYFMLSFGLFESAAGSYLSGTALFSLIPGISNPMLMMASLVFTALSSVLFYAFEVTFLKNALGIPSVNSDFILRIETYSSQLKTTIAINQLLKTLEVLDMDNVAYDEFVQLTRLFNQDLRDKHDRMGPYPESFLTNSLKIAVLIFGALSSMAGSYFFAHALLTALALSLTGTPIGWALIGLTMLAGLGFYYAMDATSMIRLVHPAFDTYKTLEQDLACFKDAFADDLTLASDIKHRSMPSKLTFFPVVSANEDALIPIPSTEVLSFESFRLV